MKIGLIGPFGLGNLGDAAIQQAMIENIHRIYPNAEIFGFSLNPEDTCKRHGIKSFSIGRMAINGWLEGANRGGMHEMIHSYYTRFRSSSFKPFRILGKLILAPINEIWGFNNASQHLSGMSYLIVSGGGQLDDYWGGAWHHPYTLFLWGLLAQIRKVKYYFISVGAGPLSTAASRIFDRWALSFASYRSYRDKESKDFLKKIGFERSSDQVFPDLAFSLDISSYHLENPLEPQDRLVIGIGPIIYFRPGNWPEQDQKIYNEYLTKLACFIASVLQNNHKILFFTGDFIHDRCVIEDLKELLAQMGVQPLNGQIIEEPIESVNDLMNQISKTDLVIASRFHGVLLSILLNKPVIALSYHRKIEELMKDTGQSDYCLPIDRFTDVELQKAFDRIVANSSFVKQQLAKRVNTYREELNEQYQRIFTQ